MDAGLFHFPSIKANDPLDKQVLKIQGEIQEFRESQTEGEQMLEVLDILHAAETLVRKFFRDRPHLNFEMVKDQVILKNQKRGYYG